MPDKKGAIVSNDVQLQPANENGEMVDAVWGKLDGNSPNYRNLSWIRASIIMIKSQVSLLFGFTGSGRNEAV